MFFSRFSLCLMLCVLAPSAFGQTAREAILSAHILGTSQYTSVEATMEIHGKRGDQTRRIEVFIHRMDSGESRILSQVVWPAFLTNMKFLMHSEADGNQERWMKTSRGVRRLSNANFSDSVFNSDFTVEDFSYLDGSDYDFSYHGSDGQDGLRVVAARAVDSGSEIRTKVFRIDSDAKLIREIDYLNSNGELVRKYRTLETQQVAGLSYPERVEMRDLRDDTSTEITIDSIDTRRRIPARTFSRAGL